MMINIEGDEIKPSQYWSHGFTYGIVAFYDNPVDPFHKTNMPIIYMNIHNWKTKHNVRLFCPSNFSDVITFKSIGPDMCNGREPNTVIVQKRSKNLKYFVCFSSASTQKPKFLPMAGRNTEIFATSE